MGQPVAHSQTGTDHLGLTVRCIVEPKGDQWQAFSLEFGLAAQGDSMEDAKRRLDAMIQSYVSDALAGEDRDHAHELLIRRATLPVYFRYYLSSIFTGVGAQSYHDPIALEPKSYLA